MLAYIDPGTGSAFFYIVSGIVVSFYFIIRGSYYRALELIFRAGHRQKKYRLAIHSEHPRYESTFMPVIRALGASNTDVTYLTMYPRDDRYEALPACVVHEEIDPGMVGYAYLNHIEAEVLVTTTPQLDVMTFRRSSKVGHYVYIQHALNELLYLRPYAYDYYDTVFACGELLTAAVRRMESIRELPPKRILATGVPHFDELLKHVSDQPLNRQDPLVLVSPSWGPQSIFQVFGTELVKQLAAKYRVLVRPHPQMRISQPTLFDEVMALKGVEVDTSASPAQAMMRADIMVSDVSGIMHEFAFIHERPVIMIDHQLGIGGLEGELLGGTSKLKERCRSFIVPVDPGQIDTIVERIPDVLKRHDSSLIAEVRERSVYQFGNAGATAAAQIREILS